jgi:hypothetical protein
MTADQPGLDRAQNLILECPGAVHDEVTMRAVPGGVLQHGKDERVPHPAPSQDPLRPVQQRGLVPRDRPVVVVETDQPPPQEGHQDELGLPGGQRLRQPLLHLGDGRALGGPADGGGAGWKRACITKTGSAAPIFGGFLRLSARCGCRKLVRNLASGEGRQRRRLAVEEVDRPAPAEAVQRAARHPLRIGSDGHQRAAGRERIQSSTSVRTQRVTRRPSWRGRGNVGSSRTMRHVVGMLTPSWAARPFTSSRTASGSLGGSCFMNSSTRSREVSQHLPKSGAGTKVPVVLRAQHADRQCFWVAGINERVSGSVLERMYYGLDVLTFCPDLRAIYFEGEFLGGRGGFRGRGLRVRRTQYVSAPH